MELLLKNWDKSREIERDEIYRDLSGERKLELLSYIAMTKFEQEQYVLFEQEELEGYIGEFLGIDRQKSREVIRSIESQHGLLVERVHKIWSFSHLTFQEYLVAKCLVHECKWQLFIGYIYQDKYREIFLNIAEILGKVDGFIKAMKVEIDGLIAFDKYLQTFLEVVYNTSSIVKSDFKPAFIRGFYFAT